MLHGTKILVFFFVVVVAIYTYTNQELPEVALLFTMVCFEYASWYVSMNTGTIGHVSNLCVGSNTQITDKPCGTSVHAYIVILHLMMTTSILS